jgi:fermentation-respiration switch protein FrsA (DUF1100 family)
MWLDFYMFLTLASGIALAVWGWQLCSIHIPHREDTHRLRTARAILAASYFILAIPAFCELFNGGEADRKIIAVFTVAVAAYQSLLFTVTLLTFIQPLYVTCHRVRIQAGIVTVAVALFLFMALTSEECWVFFVALAVYAVQLVCYTLLFRRKYAECLRLLEEYYDEDQHARLRWTKFGFYAALSVGIAASLSVWLPPVAYNIFTVGYILFYGWFAVSAAKTDPRLKAVATVSMYDMGSAARNGLKKALMPEQRKQILSEAAEQRYVEFQGGEVKYTGGTIHERPDASNPIQQEFYDFYRTERGEYTPKGASPETTTHPTLTSNVKFMNFYPFNDIETISPRALLFITGDTAHSREFSEDAYARAAEPKELYIVPGAGHVDLYDRTGLIPFDKLEDFFRKSLK